MTSAFAHELVLRRPAEELADAVVPFVVEGLAAGEPALLLTGPGTSDAIRTRVGDRSGLEVVPAVEGSARPAALLRDLDALLRARAPRGGRLRVVSEPPAVPARDWHEWRRLEAAVNVVLARHPVRTVCAYDPAALTAGMLDDVRATHPLITRDGHPEANPRYEEPAAFLGARRDAPVDPVERTRPDLVLREPLARELRAVVVGLAQRHRLPEPDARGLVFAANEVLTNAVVHGYPPVSARLWGRRGEVVVAVTDGGSGATDPFVGMVSGDGDVTGTSGRGLGLWLSHQLVDVVHRRHDEGYTVLLRAAHPLRRANAAPGPAAG